jgi:hypothetical protein
LHWSAWEGFCNRYNFIFWIQCSKLEFAGDNSLQDAWSELIISESHLISRQIEEPGHGVFNFQIPLHVSSSVKVAK